MTSNETEKTIVVISGASKGIGRGIAEYYLEKGAAVYGCSRGPGYINSKLYHHAEVDISDEKQVSGWVRSIKRSVGKIDLLICNAGYAPAMVLTGMTSGDLLTKTMSTNFNGTYFLCREVSKVMMKSRQGRIITVSSMSVGLHEEGTSAYSASKSAIVELTKILAKELSLFGITCNVIAPSMFKSEALTHLGDEIITQAKNKLTVKRELEIEEICHVVSFLASPLSAAVTGQVLHLGLVV